MNRRDLFTMPGEQLVRVEAVDGDDAYVIPWIDIRGAWSQVPMKVSRKALRRVTSFEWDRYRGAFEALRRR